MISISGKKWTEIKVNKNLIEKVNQDFNFGQLVSKLIVSRNFDLQEIYSIRYEIKINNEFIKNIFVTSTMGISYKVGSK